MSDEKLPPQGASGSDLSIADGWTGLKRYTPARIALGRSGASMPTREVLNISLSHALARDAVHQPLDAAGLDAKLAASGWDHLHVASRAGDRSTYLVRPDLARRLDAASVESLRAKVEAKRPPDIVFVIGDGLSPLAVDRYAAELLDATRPLLPIGQDAPVVIAEQARVALGDEVAEIFGARLVVVLIGERPGLSSHDSLGIYLTHAPRIGTPDSARNCISNVRAKGLVIPAAASKLAWFIKAALDRGVTGVALKDESSAPDALPLGKATRSES